MKIYNNLVSRNNNKKVEQYKMYKIKINSKITTIIIMQIHQDNKSIILIKFLYTIIINISLIIIQMIWMILSCNLREKINEPCNIIY